MEKIKEMIEGGRNSGDAQFSTVADFVSDVVENMAYDEVDDEREIKTHIAVCMESIIDAANAFKSVSGVEMKCEVTIAALTSEPNTYETYTVNVLACSDDEAFAVAEHEVEALIVAEFGNAKNVAGYHHWSVSMRKP